MPALPWIKGGDDMMINELSEILTIAYDNLMQATGGLYEVNERLNEAQSDLALERARIILENSDDPKALGANEVARNARLDDLTAEKLQRVKDCEHQARLSRHRVEMARLRVEGLRAQLRCLEVASGTLARA